MPTLSFQKLDVGAGPEGPSRLRRAYTTKISQEQQQYLDLLRTQRSVTVAVKPPNDVGACLPHDSSSGQATMAEGRPKQGPERRQAVEVGGNGLAKYKNRILVQQEIAENLRNTWLRPADISLVVLRAKDAQLLVVVRRLFRGDARPGALRRRVRCQVNIPQPALEVVQLWRVAVYVLALALFVVLQVSAQRVLNLGALLSLRFLAGFAEVCLWMGGAMFAFPTFFLLKPSISMYMFLSPQPGARAHGSALVAASSPCSTSSPHHLQ